jgi:hypothetical protein
MIQKLNFANPFAEYYYEKYSIVDMLSESMDKLLIRKKKKDLFAGNTTENELAIINHVWITTNYNQSPAIEY